MAGIAFVPAAELIALKRLSVLLALLGAGLSLGERTPRGRLLAAALMVAGAAWISLGGR